MPPQRRPDIWLPPGELRAIEAAATHASQAVEHLRTKVNRYSQPCGHRVTTTCTPTRCTVASPFVR